MDRGIISLISASTEETIAIGQKIGQNLKPGAVLCLFGDVGAGKTTLIKGIISALTAIKPEEVCSPTFSYLNIYKGKLPVYHFDLYRLNNVEDFLGMGFEEYLFSEGVCCLEWSERIASILPKGTLKVTLTHAGEERRELMIEGMAKLQFEPKCAPLTGQNHHILAPKRVLQSPPKFQNAKFIKTVVCTRELPPGDDLPEIAVVGRSNVGKSTLLNHLFSSKNLVKTSSTPGKTRALNFFRVDEQLIFVDMPGYGYANVAKSEKEKWKELIESYLNSRENLKVILFLFDIRREAGEEELQMLAWILHHKVPSILVLTKVDKVSKSVRSAQTMRITSRIKGLPYVHYSATKNEGRKELIAQLREKLREF